MFSSSTGTCNCAIVKSTLWSVDRLIAAVPIFCLLSPVQLTVASSSAAVAPHRLLTDLEAA